MKNVRRIVFFLSIIAFALGVVMLVGNFVQSIPPVVIGVLVVSAIGVGITSGAIEVLSWKLPDPEEPPASPSPRPLDPIEKAHKALNEAEQFSSRTERKVRIRIETDEPENE